MVLTAGCNFKWRGLILDGTDGNGSKAVRGDWQNSDIDYLDRLSPPLPAWQGLKYRRLYI